MPEPITIVPRVEPKPEAALNKLVETLDWQLDNPVGGPRPIGQTGLLEQIGTRLWDASGLSDKQVLDAIDKARDDDSGTPARLIVTGEKLQHWPWELLYHGHQDLGFLGRHPWAVVSRRVRGEGSKAPLAAAKPFRILLFISSPVDLDAEKSRLDFEREEELLFTALDGPWAKGDLDIDVAEDGALGTLLERLEKRFYHAVILSMHGTSTHGEGAQNSEGEKEWGLLFEDKRTGRGAPVAGSTLAAQLDQLPAAHRPGLVVLSACRSARAEESADSITSVARKIHEAGMERVLGMRLSVLDGAASAFSTELFRRAAQGEVLGRAVTLARGKVAEGAWIQQGKDPARGEALGDLFGQWSLPVLLDRTADGPLLDPAAPGTQIERPPLPTVVSGDRSIELPSRAAFIGRRMFIREHLRGFVEGRAPRLLFSGPGGVGKTALAGYFGRSLLEREPRTRLLGFRAPFDLGMLYELLRQEAFDGHEDAALLPDIQAEPDPRKRIARLLTSLAQREHPCAFVLDNLESLQDMYTLEVPTEHEESLWFLDEVCSLPSPTRVLLTGRYALRDLPEGAVQVCRVPDAPYGDVLRRMNRLDWPAQIGAEKVGAEQKRTIYQRLGGNHRALEWMAQLVVEGVERAEPLMAALEAVQTPLGTPEEATEVVLEAMRQNLLFTALRGQLTPEQDRLLRAASLYRVPFTADGLLAVDNRPELHEASRTRLLEYSLLEMAYEPSLELEYFLAPPVVRELLGAPGFEGEEQQGLHEAIGKYHRFQGRYLSRRWSDYLEAIHHFRLAGKHEAADELAETVAGFYQRIGNFAEAKDLCEEIVERAAPAAPWWAWVRFGECLLTLGSPQQALAAFERALSFAKQPAERGTTLNDISQVYRAGGDYETALRYLERSLDIRRETGDKAGQGTTLNNMGSVAHARGDYETALRHLEQSLEISREIGDKEGEATTLNNMGNVAHVRGDNETALRYLEQSLEIRREIGDKAGDGAALNNISQIYSDRGDNETALRYLEQSLEISREIGDKAGEGATLSNMGSVAHARGDNETALRYFKQSLEIVRQIGDKAGEGATLNNISQIYRARGDNETALRHLEQSLEIRREIGDKAGEGATLSNMGSAAYAQGNYESALRYFEEGHEIVREIGHKAAMITTLHNMAEIALQAGDGEKALSHWSEALSLAMETRNAEGIFNVAGTLGRVLAGTGQKDEGRRLLTLAVDTGKQAGFPGTGVFEQALRELGEE